MPRNALVLIAALTVGGCAPPGAPPSVAPVAVPAATDVGSELAEIGRYRLTRTELLRSTVRDSIYRFTDGTTAIVSVIRYDVPSASRIGANSQAWTAGEGAKFEEIQQGLVEQGRIESFRTAFSNSRALAFDGTEVMEHSIAIAVRAGGAVRMDFQYLYLIGGRFLKVRGTFQGESWKTSEIADFSSEVARRVHLASK